MVCPRDDAEWEIGQGEVMAKRMPKLTSALITEALNALASKFVGDGKGINYYFVTDRSDVVTVTDDYQIARASFEVLARRRPMMECALEDRHTGVIADICPTSDEPSAPLEYHSAPAEEPKLYRA